MAIFSKPRRRYVSVELLRATISSMIRWHHMMGELPLIILDLFSTSGDLPRRFWRSSDEAPVSTIAICLFQAFSSLLVQGRDQDHWIRIQRLVMAL